MEDNSKMDDCIKIFENIKYDILSQINLIRENAKQSNSIEGKKIKYSRIEGYDETECYNNISILGARGSGKTSLLINLKNNLVEKSNENSDIVFDIITPDIKDKEDILGWIISLLIKVSKEIKSEKYPDNKLNCNSCKVQIGLDKCIYELKKSYFFRKTIHETIIAKDYSGKIDYLNDNEEKLNADVDIKNKVKDLISEIIKILEQENKGKPLLIFMFDDVDIHSNKINEVLYVIMNYLSHPNIVNLIAGDYKSALENITLKMLEEDNILEAGLINTQINKDKFLNENILRVREVRSYEFLKKILPPEYRHYIPNLDNKTKYEIFDKYLINEIKEDEFCKELIGKIKRYILFENQKVKYYKINFIRHVNTESVVLYDYMAFLDTSIRGTINVINFIKSRIMDKQLRSLDDSDSREAKFKFLKDLLNVIIVSNRDFNNKEKLIRNTINLSQYNHEFPWIGNEGLNFNGYINYYAIVDDMNKYYSKNTGMPISENEFNIYYNIFMLSNIFEIFIIAMGLRSGTAENSNARVDRLHGLSEYLTIVNIIRGEDKIKIIPTIKEDSNINKYLKESILIKQNIFKSLRYNEVQQLFKEKNSGYLESIYIDSFNHTGEVSRYIAEVFDKDRDWSKSIIDWIIGNVPSEGIITKNLINNLEKKYVYTIGSYNYDKIEGINFDLIETVEYDIGQSIDEYIKFIRICRESYEYKNSLNYKLEDKHNNIDRLEIEIEILESEIEESSYCENVNEEYEKINKILKDINEFLNSEINKEAWRRVSGDLIIDDESDLFLENAFFTEDIINVDIALELKNLGISADFLNHNKKVIITKANYLDNKHKSFIKEYYIKNTIKTILINEHPIMRLNSKNRDLEISQIERNKIKKDMETIDLKVKLLEEDLYDNSIYKYINIKYGEKQFENSNETIGMYIKEFIELVLARYEKEIHKKNKFESLLDYFYEYIKEIKSVDKDIIELLSARIINLSEERIEMYKSEFKKIRDEITVIDINNITSNIIKNDMDFYFIGDEYNELERKIKQLNSKLEIKTNFLNDGLFMLKKDLLHYAFYRTLDRHLEDTVDYENEQMREKVRTEYLIKKREKLEEISNEADFISLKRYLKSKSN